MAELDLSRAVEATAKQLAEEYVVGWMSDFEREQYRDEAGRLLTAALPHILDALADEADRETARLFESGANTDRDIRLMNEHLRTRDYLRAKSEELRNG